MCDSNFAIEIIAVIYCSEDDPGEHPKYVQVDAEFYDCNVRRATFFLPYEKFNLKQIRKRCPWAYSYGSRKKADQELVILLEEFMDRPDLDPVYERIVLDRLPKDLDNVYFEMRKGQSRLIPLDQIEDCYENLEEG